MGGKCDNKKGDLNLEHPFSRVSGYKRGSGIKEGDITEVGVYEIGYKARATRCEYE